MRRRIALMIGTLAGGGIQRTALVLGKEFARRGHDVDLLVLRSEGELVREMPREINLIELGARGYPDGLLPFVRYLRQMQPDGFIAATPLGNLAALLAVRLARVPVRVVTTDATDPARVYHPEDSRFRSFLLPVAARFLYPGAAARVAVSDGVADAMAIIPGIARETVETVYNPIDVRPVGQLDSPVHPWLQAGRSGPVVISVGRFHAIKDYGTLIAAFGKVRAVRTDARLILFGEGKDRPNLTQQIAALGLTDAVNMPGFSWYVRSEIAAADLFVMSSLREGLGNALIEALAEGCPVVSTDCPFGPREILEGGKHGRLVPVSDPDAMAEAILAALAEPRIEGDRSHLERFDVERIVDRYERLMFPD